MEKKTINGKDYVVADEYGSVYWKEEDGEVGFAPMNSDDTFNETDGGIVETWEEVDPSDKDQIIALLG